MTCSPPGKTLFHEAPGSVSPQGSPPDRPRRALNHLLVDQPATPVVGPIRKESITVVDKELLTTLDTAKSMEWQAAFTAMKEAFVALLARHKIPATCQAFIAHIRSLPELDHKKCLQNRLTRCLEQYCKQGAIPPSPDLGVCAASIARELETNPADITCYDTIEKALRNFVEPLQMGHSTDILLLKTAELARVAEYTKPHKAPERSSGRRKYLADVESVCQLLFYDVQAQSSHYKPLVLTILYKIRDALNNDQYSLSKTDAEVFTVQFLHTLCLATFCDTKVVPAFTVLGNKLHSMQPLPPDLPMQLLLRKAYTQAVEHGAATDDPPDKDSLWNRCRESFGFAIECIQSNLSAHTAFENLRRHLSCYFSTAKDHHGFYNNNPGVLYGETITVGEQPLTATAVVAASPAYGNTVAPEFLAVCQALENRHFHQIAGDPFAYCRVVYTNLHNESLQTKTLMRLNEFYPHSFNAITVSQDSFAATLKGTQLDEKVKEDFYNALIADSNFELLPKTGFYFPPNQKERWKKALRFIVDASFKLALAKIRQNTSTSQTSSQNPNQEQIVAFCELVKLGIIRYHELYSTTQPLPATGDCKALWMRLCATCVDRGGKINTTFLWALGAPGSSGQPSWNQFVTSVWLGRALTAKGRLQLPSRLEEMGVLTNMFSEDDIKAYFDEIASIVRPDKTIRSQGLVVAR